MGQGGTGGSTPASACVNIGAVRKAGDTMTGNLTVKTSLYPSLLLTPSYNGTVNRSIVEGSYLGATSLASWQDATGDNRRMLEIRNAGYQAGLDQALVLRTVASGNYNSYRIFHAGMSTPVPIEKGGTGGGDAKIALNNMGVFYAEKLPDTGVDGQICLVPVS